MYLQLKTIAWAAIVSFGLFNCPGISTRADAATLIPTFVDIIGNPTTAEVGQSVTFTVALTALPNFPSPPDVPLPGETIDVTNRTLGTDLGSVITNNNGVAFLTAAFASTGLFDIEASFAEDSTNTASTSDAFETVVPAPATPLPATLPLFATGLGGLGLLGWRRKRRSRVSLLGVA